MSENTLDLLLHAVDVSLIVFCRNICTYPNTYQYEWMLFLSRCGGPSNVEAKTASTALGMPIT